MAVIATDRLVKQFGRIRALNGVSIRVEKGEIYGLLGQNGAGKTTLIKILLGILSSTDGKADLLGQPVGTPSVRRKIGYLPEDHRFPDYHTAVSLLDLYGALLDVPAKVRHERGREVLREVGLGLRMNTKIRTYSKGMKQRLGIAQAIMHDPDVIFLDEPTDGVDPVGRREIRDLLQRLKNQGKTIFINSHLLGEVELICDRVAILQRGELIREGDIATLTKMRGTFQIGLADEQTFPEEKVRVMGYKVSRRPTSASALWEVELVEDQSIDPVINLLFQSGLRLRHLVEKRQTLEDLFVATVEGVEPGVERRVVRRKGSGEGIMELREEIQQ